MLVNEKEVAQYHIKLALLPIYFFGPYHKGRALRLYLFCLSSLPNKKKDTAPIPKAGECNNEAIK
jgi:hypothetical protein